ncbi:hypothetical protein T459_13776 [Capsicum annuum]|uniref:C2 NT-type domain-containing protein n=1 Tax=Capsicum annuum TaxID=4072 RepID=A0A2G2ZFS6_CAPAN|nr:hypothetical protein T459_13776 [Capsicum annuum]
MGVQNFDRLRVEIKWKGSSKGISLNLGSFNRRSVKKNFTKEECLKEDEGIVEWNEEFLSVCKFSGWKDGVFQPWEVVFTVINGTSKGPNQKVPVLSSAALNLVDFALVAGDKQEGIEIFVPLEVSVGIFKSCLSLCVRETKTHAFCLRSCIPAATISEPWKGFVDRQKWGGSLKVGLRKVKFLKALSFRRHKKAYHAEEGSNSDGRNSVRSEDPDYVYPVDTNSLDEDSVGESEKGKEDTSVQKSFSYEALIYAKYAGGSFCSNTSGSSSDEDLVHYNHHISDTKHKYPEDKTAANQSAEQSSKCSLLSWRKRKLSFKYPKTKGEPLLNKHYGADGANDIGFDRQQLCSSNESSSRWHKSEETSPISVSKFGDESFAVGSWEQKEIISLDGQMKLQTQIFFASIDQRSERAVGESTCTALVAVIADWFHCNPEDMPINS